MCRVLGISYDDRDEILSPERIILSMFMSMWAGGPDAWGYFRYDGEDIWTYKEPGCVMEDVPLRRLYRDIRKTETQWFVGHVRKQTHGSRHNNANNHPIQHGNIIGVHNGVLLNHEDVLAVTGRSEDDATVDSEAIFAAVNKWGHIPGLRKIVGSMVAVYADVRKPEILHVARSNSRQLHIAFTKRGNIIFASERIALLRLEMLGVEFEGLSSVREYRHLAIRDGKIIHRKTYLEDFVPPVPVVPAAYRLVSPENWDW